MTRLSRIFVGYLAACLAASFVIAIFAFLVAIESEAPSLFKFLELAQVVTWMMIAYAAVPALAVIAYGEANRIRSPAFYVVAGAIAASVSSIMYIPGGLIGGLFLLVAPIGLIAGLIYWRIAGRSAGWEKPGHQSDEGK